MGVVREALGALRGQVRKLRREGIKKLIKDVLNKCREYLITMAAFLLVSGVTVWAAAYLPTPWQSRLLTVLREARFPEKLLPPDPEALTITVDIGNQGFGYVTLFKEAEQQPGEPIHYDTVKMPHVLVCHRWVYTGRNRFDALKAFIMQHPDCFALENRGGGGLKIEPKEIAGDYIRGSDGRIVAFTCECRPNLKEVEAKFLRDQGN
jgi:hypothetical protein